MGYQCKKKRVPENGIYEDDRMNYLWYIKWANDGACMYAIRNVVEYSF